MSSNSLFSLSVTKAITLSALAMGMSTLARAEPPEIRDVSDNLAQVVIFNDGSTSREGGANIYVDKHFNSALRVGEYVTLCVQPGQHTIESYFNDAPKYIGKQHPQVMATMQGGHTYFLSTTANGIPTAVTREVGIRAIMNARTSQFVNRSPSVVACDYSQSSANQAVVTFAFNGSKVRDIPATELANLEVWTNNTLQRYHYQKISVEGYADSTGRQSYNHKLSERRANTVANLLINQGIRPDAIIMQGKGPDTSKAVCTMTNPLDRKECNKANRRVTVKLLQ